MQVEPARLFRAPSLEFLQRRRAEIRVKALAVNRDRLKFIQIRIGWDHIILIALVALELSEFHALRSTLQEVGVVVRVGGGDQGDRYRWRVGCVEPTGFQGRVILDSALRSRSAATDA